jgi:hypothetical protein
MKQMRLLQGIYGVKDPSIHLYYKQHACQPRGDRIPGGLAYL